MTKQETIQMLQSIEDRAVDFPYMTACDWVAIAAAKRHLQEEPVSDDLEEACEQLAENARKHKAETSSPFFSQTDYKQGVIDGAKWQNEKNKQWLADNHKQIFNNGFEEGFEAGRDDMEEQLKKDAIAGEWFRCGIVLPSEYYADNIKKVKLIIFKED